MSQTLITSRDPKGLHAVGLFEAAYNKARLDAERAQRLNERGGELQDGIAKLIAELTTSNRYANEEVHSDHTYPKEYEGAKAIEVQVKALADIFSLDPSHALEFLKQLPILESFTPVRAWQWIEWFAIPSVPALAKKHFSEVTDPVGKYRRAVQLVHAKIMASRSSRSFYDDSWRETAPYNLRQVARTLDALDFIAETQKGDILITAAQLGMRHRGKSVRRAYETFAINEFGLGSLAVGSIVLVHPERLVDAEELYMDCPGDEFALRSDSDPCKAPCLYCSGKAIKIGAGFVDRPHERFGSATAFIPQ